MTDPSQPRCSRNAAPRCSAKTAAISAAASKARHYTFLAAALAFMLPAADSAGQGFIGLGGGVTHTSRLAGQASVEVADHVELHAASWGGHSRNSLAAIGYRFEFSERWSLMLGLSYASQCSCNLAEGWNGASEVRFRFAERWACQFTHYSGEGSDPSDNMVLCGYLWQP